MAQRGVADSGRRRSGVDTPENSLGGEWVKGPGKQRRGERENEDGAHGTQ